MERIDELIEQVEEFDEQLAEELEMEYSTGRSLVADKAGEEVGRLFVRLSWNMGGPFDDGFLTGCTKAGGEESPEMYMRLAERLEGLASQARQRTDLLQREKEGSGPS